MYTNITNYKTNINIQYTIYIDKLADYSDYSHQS